MNEVLLDSADVATLRARAVRGSVWVTTGFGARIVLKIGSNLVLTRLLFPDAFGLMALVNVFIAGLEMFSDVGLQPSIVQNPRGDDPVFLRTAWTIQVGRGTLLCLLATLAAAPVARFYDQPELARLLPVVALATLIGGFESTALPRLNRHMSLGRLTLLQLAAQVVSIAVMMVWAVIHPTVWALVAGSLAVRFVTTPLSHLMLRGHRDGFGWDRDALRHLLRFGSWIFVSTVLTFFASQADRLIFGKTVPMAMLGVYSIALMFASLPTQLMQRIHGSVVFPAFSRKLGAGPAGADFGPWYRRVRLVMLVYSGLGITALAASGPWLIATLYDPRYGDAGWILQLLAFGTWAYALAGPSGSALLALGEPRWLALANGAKVAGIALLIPLGFRFAEFPGAIAGFAGAEILRYAALAIGTRRAGLGTFRRDLMISLVAAGAALAGFSAAEAVAARDVTSWVSLAAALATSAAVWTGCSYALARQEGLSWQVLMRSLRP